MMYNIVQISTKEIILLQSIILINLYLIFRQFSSVLNPKERVSKDLIVEDKKLEAIFKLDLVAEKDASDIQCIWEEYHKNKEVISATIPLDVYEMVHEKMKDYPTFLFPLPRSEGYEFVMCQCHGHTVHFTPLLAFQVSILYSICKCINI